MAGQACWDGSDGPDLVEDTNVVMLWTWLETRCCRDDARIDSKESLWPTTDSRFLVELADDCVDWVLPVLDASAGQGPVVAARW